MFHSTNEIAGVVGNLRTTLSSALDYVDLLPISFNPLEVAAGQDLPVCSFQIRALITERRRRDDFFPPDLFGDPAWDMLLVLYATYLEQQRITATKLCQSAAVPPSTALRWIKTLDQKGLISKQGDPLDARRVFVALSPKGETMMGAYFHGKAP